MHKTRDLGLVRFLPTRVCWFLWSLRSLY